MDLIIAKDILKANDQIAGANRARFDGNGVLGVNVMGSPGSGKTTLLERLAVDLDGKLRFAVIEGDLATSNDAERLERAGIQATQINTGGGCHLDANMVAKALERAELVSFDVVFIENVGNLVCPSSYQLGERRRVVLLSTPEGDDKVAKYPPMFTGIDALVITKADLHEYVEFDAGRVEKDARVLSPEVKVFNVCAKNGSGMTDFVSWLAAEHRRLKAMLARGAEAP